MSSDCDWRWLRFMPVSLQFSQRELGMSRTSWLLTVALAVLLASLLLFVDEAQAQDGDLTEQSNGGAGQDPETESPANRATCDEAPDVFFLLCEVFNLITTEYVDPIDDTASLADASAQGVRDAELELIDADSEPPVCALPTPDFEETCAEIDKAEDAAAAVWAAAAQMVSSLGDRNTALITEIYQQGIDDLLENVQQRLGMGLALLDGEHPCEEFTETCRPVIFEIYPDSPAASAGLMAGDVVLEVNGPLPSDLSCAAVSNLDKFSGGETAVVKVSRADGDDDDTDPDTVTVTLESAKFDVPVVRNRVVDGEIGYLRLDAFSSSSATKNERTAQRFVGRRCCCGSTRPANKPGRLCNRGHRDCRPVSARPDGSRTFVEQGRRRDSVRRWQSAGSGSRPAFSDGGYNAEKRLCLRVADRSAG